MFIKQITSQHRNDFSAIMQCEHCAETVKNNCGYNDANYHERVIPAMYCPSCGKNKAGEVKQKELT
jgi:hypothetical protein